MVEYLSNHFRYWTANSWNQSKSYAFRVKICDLYEFIPKDLSPDERSALIDRMYDCLQLEEAFEAPHKILREFDARHRYRWQIGSNGRSGGYLVLYQGGVRDDQPYSMPGKGTDMDEDFTGAEKFSRRDGWGLDDVRERYDLVKDFDATCERAIKAYIEYAKTHRVVTETILVEKQVLVGVEIEEEEKP
jgi:hypothetical protein